MLYDLHMHSCLSPCAEDDMTPANIAGLAKLAGAELIAVTDHNAADNLPAVQCCCNAYGLRLLPGVEVNTAEEIHVLCYFKTVDTALEFGRLLYAALPEFPYDPAVWGRQLVMDENDEVLRTVDKLLTGAVSMDIYEVKAACEALGGVAVPAHVEKDSYALLSVLGFCRRICPLQPLNCTTLPVWTAWWRKGCCPLGWRCCPRRTRTAWRMWRAACMRWRRILCCAGCCNVEFDTCPDGME